MSDDTNTHTPIVELVWAHKNALSTIEKQNKIIELLEKSNEFYADIDNWEATRIKDDFMSGLDLIMNKDLIYIGGKLARETREKVKELRSEE